MKRFLALFAVLLPLIHSCTFPQDVYTVTNCTDFFRVSEGVLYNEYGRSFNVSQDGTDKNWKDCARIYAEFDILNSNLDIYLKNYAGIKEYIATEGIPAEDAEGDYKDYFVILDHAIGYDGYMSLRSVYYQLKGSNYAHRTLYYYSFDKATETLNIAIFHDGNLEDPANHKADELETHQELSCINLRSLLPEGTRAVSLSLVRYSIDTDGKAVRATIPLAGGGRYEF